MKDAGVNIAALDLQRGESEVAETRAGTVLAALMVFALALACYLPLLGSAPLAGTEGHRALTAHQMVESGEWMVPRLYGKVYLAKPPLHYWIIGAFEKISGKATPFVWRLPSALEGAMLAAMLSLFGGRWFGRIGALVAGLSYITLITLWGEDRGADIDVTNSLAATLAACCILEIHFGRTKRRVAWALLGGVATGAALMVKGPAGMTIIFGALIWACIDAWRSGHAARLARPETWLPILIGAALFAAYALAAWLYIRSHHLAKDMTGVQEGIQDLHPHDWTFRRAFEWVTLPMTMFLFAMPTSLAILFVFRREVRGRSPALARMLMALTGSVLLAWGINFISGMHLPRYAFVTLPLLCPLAGGVASRVPEMRSELVNSVRAILIGTAILFSCAVVGFTIHLWKHSATRRVDIVVVVAAAAVCIGTVLALLRGRAWRAAWGVAMLACLLSIPFGYERHYDRMLRTCQGTGQWIRSVTGPRAELTTCMMVLDQPDLFYYSGLPTQASDDDMLDWRKVKPNSWVVLESPELKEWKAKLPPRSIPEVHQFAANKNLAGYLVWYAGE